MTSTPCGRPLALQVRRTVPFPTALKHGLALWFPRQVIGGGSGKGATRKQRSRSQTSHSSSGMVPAGQFAEVKPHPRSSSQVAAPRAGPLDCASVWSQNPRPSPDGGGRSTGSRPPSPLLAELRKTVAHGWITLRPSHQDSLGRRHPPHRGSSADDGPCPRRARRPPFCANKSWGPRMWSACRVLKPVLS